MPTDYWGESVNTPLEMVTEAHRKFFGQSDTLLADAQRCIDALAAFQATPTAFNVPFNFYQQIAPFVRPLAPNIDPADYGITIPDAPQLPPAFDAQTPDIEDMPTFNEPAPVYAFGPKPTKPTMARPIAPPRPNAIAIPDAPDISGMVPERVTLQSLNLPAMPDLRMPLFSVVKPSIQPFTIDGAFDFTPEQYVSALLDKLKSKVSTLLDGQEALPAAVERALFDRGRGRIVVESRAREQEAWDDWGSRGFSKPSGILNATLEDIRQDAQDKIAEFNSDTTRKHYEEALTNFRLAITAGAQIEGITIGLFTESERIRLSAAAHARDTAIGILNARISQYNAEIAGAQLDLAMIEGQLKVELAKLELYRGMLEGEKLRGEMNQQTVDLYRAQWEAVKTIEGVYVDQLEAVKTQAEISKIPMEMFSEEMRGFTAVYDAYAKEWDGWKASVEGETAKGGLYNTLAQAFASRVQAATQKGGLMIDREKLRLAEHGQALDQMRALLERGSQLLRAEETRLSAVSQRDRAIADVFRARADVETAASASADRQFQSGLQAAIATKDTQIEQARIRSTENVALLGLLAEIKKAMAQIYSQLTASTMSAMNHSASVGYSSSDSHSKGVSWSGEADDYDHSIA